MKQKTVFITGVTGLVGSYLAKVFLENGHRVYALARGSAKETPEQRVISVLKFWDETVFDKNSGNLRVLEGDITKEKLGLDDNARHLLKKEIDEIFHCAALTEFNAPIGELRKVNVQGTLNLLDLIQSMAEDNSFLRLNYLSTAFVCGNFKGAFNEDNFEMKQNFNNNYEQSKYEAETLVREFTKNGLHTKIFRPSIIVGEYLTGKTTEFKMFYKPLRLFSLEILEEIPLDIKTYLNLMPVDLVAKAIYLLSQKNDSFSVYHVTNSNAFRITDIIDQASVFFNFVKPKYIKADDFIFTNKSMTVNTLLKPFVPYLNFYATFNSKKTENALKEFKYAYPIMNFAFLKNIFSFAAAKKFIKMKIKKPT